LKIDHASLVNEHILMPSIESPRPYPSKYD